MIDLLGMELEEAKQQLSAEGKRYEIITTAPPSGNAPEGPWRIVKQEYISDQYRLTVCKVPDSFR